MTNPELRQAVDKLATLTFADIPPGLAEGPTPLETLLSLLQGDHACALADPGIAGHLPRNLDRISAAAELEFFQSNHEGALIDKIAALTDAKIDGLVINGGALTHTSVALRDALLGAHLPTIEVHSSNIYQREEFRHTSLTAPACIAVITGLGLEGYHAARRFLLKR